MVNPVPQASCVSRSLLSHLTMKTCLLTAICIISFWFNTKGQGLSINATGVAADNSAMLDVSSNSQGVLVPRMTASNRMGISSPATGLLVYQTNGVSGFYFYNGTDWVSLNSSTTTITGLGSNLGSAVNAGTAYSLSYTVRTTDGIIWSDCTLCYFTLPAANSVPPGHVIYFYNLGASAIVGTVR